MSPEHNQALPVERLLTAIADPAVEVDADGRIVAWNDAASARFGLDGQSVGARPEALLRRWTGGSRRIALAGTAHALIAWSLDEDGLGPDEIALSKADVVGRTSGSALHEINNQLNLGIGLGGLIPMEAGLSADVLDMARDLERYGQHAHELAHGFLEFSRSRPPRRRPFRVGKLIEEAFDILAHATINMQRRVTAPTSLPEVEGDESTLRHAVFAVLINALEAQGATWEPGAHGVPGRLIVTASHRDDARGNRIRIVVEDGASPVPEAERSGLFTGAAARSTRDLVVAGALVGRLDGRVSHEPVRDGNRLVLELPVAGTTLPPAGEAKAGPPVVLLCDDDVFIRSLLGRMMERRGYRCVEARTGEEAVAAAAGQDVDLVIADGRMPDLAGPGLVDALIAARPSIASRIILMSGDPADADLSALSARTGVPVLPKPFDNARLDELIRAALDT